MTEARPVTLHLWRKPAGSAVAKHLYVTLGEHGHYEHIGYDVPEGETSASVIDLEVTVREFRQTEAMLKSRVAGATAKERQLGALWSIGYKPRKLDALRWWEQRGAQLAEDECNQPEGRPGEYLTRENEIVRGVADLFGGTVPAGFFLNGDPRGYALKLDNDKVTIPAGMVTDWGGYGILAPAAENLR